MPTSQEGQHVAEDGSPHITLFRGWEDYGKYVWSPYVTKVEARLRFAGVRYGVDELGA